LDKSRIMLCTRDPQSSTHQSPEIERNDYRPSEINGVHHREGS